MTKQELLSYIDSKIEVYQTEKKKYRDYLNAYKDNEGIDYTTRKLSASISAIEISGFILELKMLRSRVESLNLKEN